MIEETDKASRGVQEATTPWEPPAVLYARPVPEPVAWNVILDEIERDFPKTLARLAE